MGIYDNFMPGETGGMSSGVQGLLANPLLQIGLGILANNTGHYGALGPAIGLGAQQGFSNLQRQQSLQQQEQLRNLQIQQAKREADAQDRQIQEQKALSDAIGGAYSAPSAAPNMSFMDANNQAMAGQSPANAPNPMDTTNPSALPTPSNYQWDKGPSSFDQSAALQNILSNPNISGATKLSMYQTLRKNNTPIKVGKGETLINPDTFSPVFSSPDEPKYQFAPNGAVVDMNKPDLTQNYAKPEFHQFDTGNEILGGYLNNDGTYNNIFDFKKQMTPDAVATNSRELANDAANGGITDDAINAAAARYRIDGTLPPMGLGKAAAGMRAKILSQAAAMDAADGISGTDARIAQITGKNTSASLGQLSKQKTMVSAFEKNALLNGKMALDLSNQVDRTGVPIFNAWMQAGQQAVTGNVPLSKFHAANQTFINEYAKVMSGSMGNTPVSDAARAHAQSLLSTAHTKDQYAGVMSTLNQEMQNRMDGFDQEESALKSSLGAKPQSMSTSQAIDLPPKPNALNLKKGAIYNTPKGALRWNGNAFEDQ